MLTEDITGGSAPTMPGVPQGRHDKEMPPNYFPNMGNMPHCPPAPLPPFMPAGVPPPPPPPPMPFQPHMMFGHRGGHGGMRGRGQGHHHGPRHMMPHGPWVTCPPAGPFGPFGDHGQMGKRPHHEGQDNAWKRQLRVSILFSHSSLICARSQ